jgi:glycosyltransferase involved in cell wall biosynthesis
MISVLLPAYNGQSYIKMQIESILNCLSTEDELLVADDNSSDGTLAILYSFSDPRVKIIERRNNIGLVKSVEDLMTMALGDYIFLSDQDDVWLPDRIKLTLPLFDQYDLVVVNCSVVNESLDVIQRSYFDIIKPVSGVFQNIIKCRYLGCCMGMKKSLAKSVLPIPNASPSHDLWIGVVSKLMGFSVGFFYTPLIMYRRHSCTLSSAATLRSRPLANKIFDRLSFLFVLVLSIKKICSIRCRNLRGFDIN